MEDINNIFITANGCLPSALDDFLTQLFNELRRIFFKININWAKNLTVFNISVTVYIAYIDLLKYHTTFTSKFNEKNGFPNYTRFQNATEQKRPRSKIGQIFNAPSLFHFRTGHYETAPIPEKHTQASVVSDNNKSRRKCVTKGKSVNTHTHVIYANAYRRSGVCAFFVFSKTVGGNRPKWKVSIAALATSDEEIIAERLETRAPEEGFFYCWEKSNCFGRD